MPSHPTQLSPLFDPGFKPPFCPNDRCGAHYIPESFRWFRHSSYPTRLGRVPRFRCKSCRRTFSSATFSPTYYLKHPHLLSKVAAGLVAGSAQRQLARSLECSHQTVSNLAAKLGRHALLFQAQALAKRVLIREPVIYDDFETFAYCQDAAMGIGTAVGAESFFLYGFEATRHRGPGNIKHRSPFMPEDAFAKGYHNAFKRMLDRLLPLVPEGESLVLNTDDHPGYTRGLKEHPGKGHVKHQIFRNPKDRKKGEPRSLEARQRDAAHFASDLCHKLLRHSLADHRRETLAHGKRHNAVLERGGLFTIWRNFCKHRSERKPGETPAMWLGLTDKPLTWKEILSQRLFPSKIQLPPSMRHIYDRKMETPELGRNRRHDRAHAV